MTQLSGRWRSAGPGRPPPPAGCGSPFRVVRGFLRVGRRLAASISLAPLAVPVTRASGPTQSLRTRVERPLARADQRNRKLRRLYSDDPLSENWNPHPLNPVVSDVREARSAGRIFEYEGNIYRPSQNCGGRYGRGLNLSKILKLSETEFEETVIGAYEPHWDKDLLGVHHISYDRGLTLIDVRSRRSRFF